MNVRRSEFEKRVNEFADRLVEGRNKEAFDRLVRAITSELVEEVLREYQLV